MGENLYGKLGPGWIVPGLSGEEKPVEAVIERAPEPLAIPVAEVFEEIEELEE